jgi:hypothetical protein
MMTILARLLTGAAGSKLLPAGLIGGLLLMGHQLVLARDARMKAEAAASAKQVCEADHKLAAMQAERDAARRVAEKAVEAIEFERQVAEELRSERVAIKGEFDAYKSSASADPRCLSDGVLDLLRGDAKDGVRPGVGKR